MLRHWPVRLVAIAFTLSVRSFTLTATTWTLRSDAFDPRRAAQVAVRTHLARHARHCRSEAVELVHHRVDGVLERQNLALHLDGDLLGKIARRHGGRYLGDVADLAGQVGGHRVHIVGKVLPGAGDALDLGLAAELALVADLARHTRHLGGEGGKLLNHPVHDLADSQELPAQRAPVDLTSEEHTS